MTHLFTKSHLNETFMSLGGLHSIQKDRPISNNLIPSKKKVVFNRVSVFCFVLAVFLIIMVSNIVNGQVTIVSDGLNNSTTLFTLSGGAYYTGNSAAGDRPATSPFASEGTHSRGVSNSTATLTSSDINTISYSSIFMTFRLASWSISSTGNGTDAGDIVTVEVSPDGGTNYYSTVRVLGNSNAYWSYSTGTGNATTVYDGNATPVDYAPAGGGDRITDGYSTVTITGLPSTTNLRIRITLLNNSANERWTFDDFFVKGTSAITPDITLSDNDAQIVAANVNQGTSAHILHKFKLGVTTANATLTGLICNTSGTYIVSDIANLKVRYSTNATLDAGDVTLSTITPTIAGSQTFSSFTSQTINSGSTGYVFITADIAANATNNNTISVNALTNANLTFSSGNKTGSTTDGGTQTIKDVTAPTVSSFNPLDGATGVAINANLVITFNENIQLGTAGNIVIYNSDATVFETIPYNDARITFSTNTVTINPSGTFVNSAGYYAQISGTAIRDVAGNNYSGISDATTWNFTVVATSTSCASDLIISEYIEGSSNNKYIEIYNGTGSSVNLANYEVLQYNNGSSTVSYTLALSGTLTDNTTYVIENSSETLGVTANLSTSSNVMAFNGDDVIALRKGGTTIIDIVGQIGFDPGSEWGTGLISTADNTLRRKSSIFTGDSNGADVFDPSVEWDGYATDIVSGLGSHSMFCGPTITVGTITDFGDICVGNTSAEKTYNVSGSSLTANISIVPPSGYEISTGTGGSFVVTNPITLVPSGGTVTSTPIYVRFVPTLVQPYTGNITNASTGATTKNVVVSGNGVSAGANVTALTATSGQSTVVPISWTNPLCFTEVMIVAKLSSSITATPSGDGSAYTANLAFGSGTAIAAGEYVVYKGTTPPQVVTNLVNGSTYYFKVFTRNGTNWSSGVEVFAVPNTPIAIITEWSQGEPSNNNEWVEILVLQDHADLRNWELRDENSLAPNYLLKFKNVAFWQDIPIGTYILLYNPDPITWTGLPAPDGSAGDCNFLVMFSQADINSYYLEFSSVNHALWSWNNSRALSNSTNTDNPLLYDGSGNLVHDWDQGNTASFISVRPNSSEGVYYTGTDAAGVSVASNWINVPYNDPALTPGLFNTAGQGIWVNGIRPFLNCSYRSVMTNNWNTLATWESTLDGINWAPAIRIPDFSLNGTILVRNTHNVTLDADKKVDQLTIEPTGIVTIPSSITMTATNGTDVNDFAVNGTLNIQGTLVGAGTVGFLANSTLITNNTLGINGALSGVLFSFDASNSVNFNFNGSLAQVTGTWMPSICKNLTINNANGVSLSQNTESTGILTLSNGNLLVNGKLLTLSGTIAGAGTISGSATSELYIGGTAGGTLGSITFTSGAQTLNNLTMNRTGAGASVTINNDLGVLSNLSMTSGVINMGANTLEIGSSTINRGYLTYLDGFVAGKVKRWFTTATNSGISGVFPIGVSNYYRSAQIEFTAAPISGGSLTAQFISTIPAGYYDGLPLNDGAQVVDNVADEGFWQIDAGDGLTGGTYTCTLQGDGFSSVLDATRIRILKRPSGGGNWSVSGSHGIGSSPPLKITRIGMTGFSQFALGSLFAENPLPIELLDFTAKNNGKLVNLYWSTASEINNDFFTLERSSDAKSFNPINKVKGAGNSDRILNYSLIDANPIKGINYYRLKQTDYNSNFSYSKLIYINFLENSCELNISLLFIQNNSIKVQLNCVDSKVIIDILDITGKVLLTQINYSSDEMQNITIQLPDLKKGIYLIRVTTEKSVVVKKFSF